MADRTRSDFAKSIDYHADRWARRSKVRALFTKSAIGISNAFVMLLKALYNASTDDVPELSSDALE
jgi:hypothetical protein